MFGSKSKGLFFDLVGGVALAARTSGMVAPFVIEELREIPIGEPGEVADAVRDLAQVRGSGFATACCSVYPQGRIVSRLQVDSRKLREEEYLPQLVADVMKIEAAKYSLAAVTIDQGSDLASLKTLPKEVVVAGAPSEELIGFQNALLEYGAFPERMEIGTIASLGGVISLLRFTETKTPILLLEIGADTTNVFVVTREGVDITRTVAFGINSMIPVVQKELALKDEESAKKLFFSNSFDFTGMGPQLTKRLLRELQASIGFYEVQTGQSINQLTCTLLPTSVGWLQRTLADVLGMKAVTFDFVPWLRSMGIELADGLQIAELPPIWTSLFCLMGDYKESPNEAAVQ